MHPELRKTTGKALEYYLGACLDTERDDKGMSDLAYQLVGEVVVATGGRGIDFTDSGCLDHLESLAVRHLGEDRVRAILEDAKPGHLRWRSFAMARGRALELAASVSSMDSRLHCTVEGERWPHGTSHDFALEFWFEAENPCMLACFGRVEFSLGHTGSRTEADAVFHQAFADAVRAANELELAESVVAVTEPDR